MSRLKANVNTATGTKRKNAKGLSPNAKCGDRDCEGRRKDGEQRCEKREICLQLLYFLNLYP